MKRYLCQVLDNDDYYHRTATHYMEEMTVFELLTQQYRQEISPNVFQLITSKPQLIIVDPDSYARFFDLWRVSPPSDTFLIIQSYNSAYALEAYTNHVVDYLVKPYTHARFLRAINRFIKFSKVYNN